ncbi:MAG: hypothetical protein KF835_13430 [Xanthobacteraceae bacterium]|nr:hypothetical protein [Xanthobacteraceae bacterium]
MSDFNPVSLFYILYESFGVWLWILLTLAVLLLAGVFASARKRLRVGGSLKRPFIAAFVVCGVVAALMTFVVPYWTLASPSALSAGIDYLFAFLAALIPGAIAGGITFMFVSRMCPPCRTSTS